jgi:hypothetical protein
MGPVSIVTYPCDDDVFWAYVTAQAHDAVTALHAQAVSILNAKAMISIFLDNLSSHYNQWKTLFLNTLNKYELSDHVLADVTPDQTRGWGPSMALVATTLGGCPVSPAAPVGAPSPPVTTSAPPLKKSNSKSTNNYIMPSLPTPTHPFNGTLQLWTSIAAASPSGPGLLNARPGLA